MADKTNTLRKAMEQRPEGKKPSFESQPNQAASAALKKESRAQYRGYVDSINRSSDREIEHALSRF